MDLREQIAALAPWHFDFDLEGVRTGEYADGLPVVEGADNFMRSHLLALYPEGLKGRSVLDVACNAGAYLFGAKDAGAGSCLGFDARSKWVEQAQLVSKLRGDGVEFRRMELGEIGSLGDWDIVLFNGIFYHLPDPIAGLKLAADRAKETLIVNTSIKPGWPDGALVASTEDPDYPLSGVDPVNWYPTGPKTLEPVLKWLGFSEITLQSLTERVEGRPHGRMQLAARR